MSKVHLFAIYSHARFVYELILTEFAVKGAQLQRLQFKSETRATLLEVSSRTILIEFITMMSKENEISLIMKSDHTASNKIGRLREKSSQHSSYSVTSHRVKIIQD